MSQNLPKRSLRDFLSYVILTISYLQARTILRNVIITQRFHEAPVQTNRVFFWYTDCIFQLKVLSLIYAQATSRECLLGILPSGQNPFGGTEELAGGFKLIRKGEIIEWVITSQDSGIAATLSTPTIRLRRQKIYSPQQMQLNSVTQPRKCVSEFKALKFDPKFFVILYRTCGVHSKLTYSQIVLDKSLFLFSSWFSSAFNICSASHTQKPIVSSQTSPVANSWS